ncbi:hypothetical protein M514_01515 [Trichuris suis]|uniref:Uncharacterized protein n=1 Tax=Trichuris suis TaxID=68888 RepID=A0A085NAM1_9BILA|nr:hypothetical protein M513_01515 [Trichuris suis]KFD66517.1 hypothetical protein M514_01515 [Trichuris suis]
MEYSAQQQLSGRNAPELIKALERLHLPLYKLNIALATANLQASALVEAGYGSKHFFAVFYAFEFEYTVCLVTDTQVFMFDITR